MLHCHYIPCVFLYHIAFSGLLIAAMLNFCNNFSHIKNVFKSFKAFSLSWEYTGLENAYRFKIDFTIYTLTIKNR